MLFASLQILAKDFIVHKGCGKVSEVQKILKYKIVSSQQLCEITKYSIPVSNSMDCIELTDSQIFAANLNCEFDQKAYRCEATFGCLLKKKAGKITQIIDRIKRDGKLSYLKEKRNPPKSRFNYKSPNKVKKFSAYQGPKNTKNQLNNSKLKRTVASEPLLKEETKPVKQNEFFQSREPASSNRQIAISLDD